VDIESLKINEYKKKVKKGYMWAIFSALLWGIWYIPGTVIWSLDPFYSMSEDIAATNGSTVSLLVTAILITAFSALAIILTLTIWNLVTGKFKEIGRTIVQLKSCSKWFILAAMCGGPIAILGSYLAMGFVGGAFAAVASLLFPVVSSFVASKWYNEKITRRAAIGIGLIILGGISIYGGGMLTEMMTGQVKWLGYVGGAMAALGFGLEGAVAGKGIDLAEPDAGLSIRFLAETIFWWIVGIPLLIILGFPMLKYSLMIFEPLTLLILVFIGLSFGYCYVTCYKAFPLIGVGRGQGVANLYGLCAVIFIFLFFGDIPSWTLLLGGALCLIGSTVMYTENVSEEAVRG
jgi:drug/metabolite transporter (DMT)-like permease